MYLIVPDRRRLERVNVVCGLLSLDVLTVREGKGGVAGTW
jgi:hypothetical protein